MDRKQQIRDALAKLAEKYGPVQSLLVQVKTVNEGENTCVVIDDDIEIPDVRLRPVLNGEEGITIYPKVDTWALITRIEDDAEWMLIAADQVDKYRIVCADCEFEIKEGYLVKRGNDTLKEVIQNIIESVQVIVVSIGTGPDLGKLTIALNKLNNILR